MIKKNMSVIRVALFTACLAALGVAMIPASAVASGNCPAAVDTCFVKKQNGDLAFVDGFRGGNITIE